MPRKMSLQSVVQETAVPIEQLAQDLRKAARTLTTAEVRYLVDLYYQIQDFRKASGNQIASMTKSGEPTLVLSWAYNSMETIEREIKKWLDIYTDAQPMGQWAKSVTGVGPIIAAGLLAHIDIAKAPTVGHIWRFAGYDPTSKWEKGKKRPHNAALKVLCWKIGESFVKVSANPKDFYGKYYLARKAYEHAKNERGEYAEQAAKEITTKRYRTTTEAYKAYSQGRLPDGHIHARAKRYAVKLFLSHWHGEAYRRILGKEPPLPWPIDKLPEHTHIIEPPG